MKATAPTFLEGPIQGVQHTLHSLYVSKDAICCRKDAIMDSFWSLFLFLLGTGGPGGPSIRINSSISSLNTYRGGISYIKYKELN